MRADTDCRVPAAVFDNIDAGRAWLAKDFNVEHPRDLLTALPAGQVIRVLKDMQARQDRAIRAADSGEKST